MQSTFRTTNGHEFSTVPLTPLEIYISGEVYNLHHGAVVTDTTTGDKYTIFDSKHIQGEIFRLLLLPVEVQA